MKKSVYDAHSKAFESVTAGVLVVNNEQVGTIAFKFPKQGEGRVTCYLHIHGYPMVVGTASGYGYDKKAAALESACRSLCEGALSVYPQLKGLDCGGNDFQTTLRNAGFTYFYAV